MFANHPAIVTYSSRGIVRATGTVGVIGKVCQELCAGLLIAGGDGSAGNWLPFSRETILLWERLYAGHAFSSERTTRRYSVSRSTGSRPASTISRRISSTDSASGVVAPAS